MSHFTVLVVTDTPDQVEAALQPYHEYECTGIYDQYVQEIDQTEEIEMDYESHKEDYPDILNFALDWYGVDNNGVHERVKYHQDTKSGYRFLKYTNPNAKWDWWVVGGRWSDWLTLKDGRKLNEARKSDVDFDTPVKVAAEEATKEYREAMEVMKGKTFRSWKHCWDRFQDINECRDYYHDQAVLKALKEWKGEEASFFYEFEDLLLSEEDFVKKKSVAAIQTFAVLIDGKWIEKGSMGWWACVFNENENWSDDFLKIINEIPDDKYLTVVDCHI